MELKKISMAFSISTLVSLVYPSLGQENGDNHPLVNLGPEMDAVEAAVFPACKITILICSRTFQQNT
ncbi:unnamed protein product [Brassica oleracea var. botrytis]